MAVSEKIAPNAVSIIASLAGIGFCAFLFFEGESNPRLYTSHMAINHHSGYDRTYACRECHVPNGGFFLTPTCVTSSCHGELTPGTDQTSAVTHMLAYWKEHGQFEKTETKALVYLKTHANYRLDECASCHSEHKPKEKAPEETKTVSSGFRSLLHDES
ncbi:hypothetical protein GC173_03595 [bacterium]|nr:hypothetical protein [bacterium]